MGANGHIPQPWAESAARRVTVRPWPSSASQFMDRAMLGRMTPEDQAYMARAVLQMSDEIRVLRVQMDRLMSKLSGLDMGK